MRLSLFIYTIIAALVIAGCTTEPSFRAAVVSSMVKVHFDRPLEHAASVAEISAAGGEYESFQVVLHGAQDTLRDVRVSAGPLRSGGDVIEASRISVNPVGYVRTTVVCERYESSLGWWPDPLLEPQSFDLPAGQAQPVWVTVHVPRGSSPGVYQGELTVSAAGGGVRKVPLSLRVWGFDLPRMSRFKTLTWVSGMGELYGYERGSERGREIMKRYYSLLLRHRLGPGGNVPKDDEMLGFCMERGMNAFLLEVIPNLHRRDQDSYTEHYKNGLRDRLSAYAQRFGPRGWLDDGTAYVYNYDEVPREHWPLAREMYRLVKEVDPRLEVIQCLNIPEGVRAMAGFADTWDVYMAQYHRTGIEERVTEGDEAWLAVCCYPPDRPNLFHEYPAIDARLMGWICRKTGVSGFEYWSPNSWDGNRPVTGLRAAHWKANTFRDYNGDGYLLYPGEDGTPLSSVRLANLRDGFEDWEYYEILKKLGGEAAVPDSVVQSPTAFTSDPEVLYRARERAARKIEQLSGGHPSPSTD